MPRISRRGRASPGSLSCTPGFSAFVLDQLSELGDVVARSMFGGIGLYHRNLFFGIVARDTLYLKVDNSTRADYERAGMQAFKPYPNRAGTMQYYAVPVDVLESAFELGVWSRKAVAVADAAAVGKSARPRPARKRRPSRRR